MKRPAILLTVVAAASAAVAQNATLQAIAVTPIPLHAVSVLVANNTLPAGQQVTSPVGDGHFASAWLAIASVGWLGPTQVQNGAIEYVYVTSGWIEAGVPGTSGSATVDQHQILISLQTSTPRLVRIVAEVTAVASAGQPAPQFDVDLRDDGDIDGNPVNGGCETSALLSSVSVPIRLTVAAGVSITNGEAASFHAQVRLRILPLNGITIAQSGIACPSIETFRVNEAFNHNGVRLGFGSANIPYVVVLGLTAQPVVLGAHAGLPCIVFPALDAIVTGQPGGIDLPIPAAVRPFGFHAQGIALSEIQGAPDVNLVFGDSYFVFAF